MRYFYDTEFLEDGRTIELISIGIVADDGRELYAVNDEIEYDDALHARIIIHDWLMENVIPNLPIKPGTKARKRSGPIGGSFFLDEADNRVMPRRMIRNAVRDFLLTPDTAIQLWADYGAYDHVALAQLFGPMAAMPQGIPWFTNDLQQAWRSRGMPDPPRQESITHNALEDARHLKRCFDALFRPSDPWPEPSASPEPAATWNAGYDPVTGEALK